MPNFTKLESFNRPTGGADKDVSLNAEGFVFCNHAGDWACEGRLHDEGKELHFVPGIPSAELGYPGDAACSPDSLWWKKDHENIWRKQYQLIPGHDPTKKGPVELIVDSLTVSNIISLPIIKQGWIPVFDSNKKRQGYIKLYSQIPTEE